MDKIKLGFIGTGLVAQNIHWPTLKQLPDLFEVINVSSRTENKCRAFAELTGAKRWCTDYHTLLNDDEVEAVCIATPFEINYQIVKDAIAAGKHVIVEKPMAGTINQAKEMAEWEKNTTLITMVAENFRYKQAIIDAAKHIQNGTIGLPHTMQYTCYGHYDRNINWVKDSKWRLTSIGGVILDRAIHYTAAIRLLLGDVKSALGRGGKMRDDIGPMDYLALHMLFENGATGSLLDIASVTGLERREIIVVGSEGTVFLSNQLTEISVVNENGVIISKEYKADRSDSFVREFKDYYQAIKKGTPSRSSFYDGYKDLQLAITGIGTNSRWNDLKLLDDMKPYGELG